MNLSNDCNTLVQLLKPEVLNALIFCLTIVICSFMYLLYKTLKM